MKKLLLVILLLLAQSALAQFYTGLMAGGRIPLGSNKLETLPLCLWEFSFSCVKVWNML